MSHFIFAYANFDERVVAPDIIYQIDSMLGVDMGYISLELKQTCLEHGIDLQTLLRKHMCDSRLKSVINHLKRARKKILRRLLLSCLNGLIYRRLMLRIYGFYLIVLCVKSCLVISVLF